MTELSTKQNEILEYIKTHIKTKGYPPSVREIGGAVGLKSTSTVYGHLNRLEKKGYIRKDATKPRAIEVLSHTKYQQFQTEYIDVPIVGQINAGSPLLAIENIEDTFPVPIRYVEPQDIVFMLYMKGHSMIEVGMYDNDLILVKQQSSVENGDIVVAMVEELVTVKRFYKEKNEIRLEPENKNMTLIVVKEVDILGKVIGLFRTF